MSDPFDVLRREPPTTDPEPEFVETLMRAVQERLNTHHSAPPLVAESTLIDPEVAPMHTTRRPATRWLVTAAAAAAIVAGIVVVANHDQKSVDPTPSNTSPPAVASTTTFVAAPAAPAALRDSIWLRGPRVAGANGAGTAIRFSGATFGLGVPNQLGNLSFQSSVTFRGDTEFRLVANDTKTGCHLTDEGRYSWSASPNGRTLTVAAITDPCTQRAAAVSGTYVRDACREKATTCLGDLDAGSHATQYFRPLHTRTDPWAPLFGGLTYTVPDGWANWSDWPDTVGLAPSASFAPTSNDSPEPASTIEVLAHVLPAVQEAACSGKSVDTATTAAAVMDDLRGMKGLVVGPSTPATIDGLDGVAADVRADAATMTPCPGISSMDYLNMAPGNAESIAAGERTRLILLDVGDTDRTRLVVGVRINVHDAASYDAFVAQAMQIVQTFHFN